MAEENFSVSLSTMFNMNLTNKSIDKHQYKKEKKQVGPLFKINSMFCSLD